MASIVEEKRDMVWAWFEEGRDKGSKITIKKGMYIEQKWKKKTKKGGM